MFLYQLDQARNASIHVPYEGFNPVDRPSMLRSVDQDPKDHYANARACKVADFTGASAHFGTPLLRQGEFMLDTGGAGISKPLEAER